MAGTTDELKDLASLLREGLITREEFDQQKAMILSGRARGGSAPTWTSQPRIGGSNPPQAGESLGAYSLLGIVGQGGMGVVYRGRHRTAAMAKRQGGEVAIKVLHAQYAQDEVFRDRFEREAAMGGKLDHPGIVKVHDLVVDGGTLALVMDLAEGRPLSEVIGEETGPIPWERAWPMFKQMLDAVAYAHKHNIVHRDIKPENVIVSPKGKLKVLDFGIAKDMEGGKTKTGTGMGTVDYMAPEQYLDAKSVDARADVYALGMTLYEMLAGRLPWEKGTTEFTVLEKKKNGNLPPPTDFYPEIPNEVVVALQRAIVVDPSKRFSSVEKMTAALKQANIAAKSGGQNQKRCTKCNQALSPDEAFCTGCGASTAARSPNPLACRKCRAILQPDEAFCTGCGTSTAASSPNPLACRKCRAILQPDEAFCTGCGTRALSGTPSVRACSSCHAVLKKGDTFCTGCGQAVS
jgi:serine/threonine protein kinase